MQQRWNGICCPGKRLLASVPEVHISRWKLITVDLSSMYSTLCLIWIVVELS